MLSFIALVVSALFLPNVDAIGQSSCATFKSSPSTFSVVEHDTAAPIFLSEDEWPGVQRTASDFASDIERVTGHLPTLLNVSSSTAGTSQSARSMRPIIVGTLGRSSLIDQIVNSTHLDVSSIEGLWEAYLSQEVANPLPGIDSAFLIIGSDKRGTIFAMYDLSEQFGVSPWYWWADVPTTKHSELFVSSSGCSHGPPTVQYRGIFLNDEQPALQNWAFEKFTNGTGASLTNSPFNRFFYTKLFELILRMRANYLWPAQWSSAFCVDDPLNQFYADYYGVAMGTSHEEPMMRSIPVEWSLFGQGPWDYSVNSEFIYNFWVNGTERAKDFESVYTIGMRGDGDLPLSSGDAINLLEKVVSDQRQILTDVFNGTNITTIPQVWTLYKEVEGYYDEGLRAPDDVTLLWSDDNYGNIRRYPLADERNRSGGSGVYYHVDYVGSPRDYKWIVSSQIPKIFEQMSIAVDRNATRIWMLNVGDLKPYEREIEFFLTYGWNSSIWNPDNLNDFVFSWAQREFDLDDADTTTVTELVANLTRFNSRRKPESWNATTFSLTNYREAERVLNQWSTLLNTSTEIYNKLSADMQPAFFQLIHHPISASSNLANMLISAGLNNLRASQARLSTNDLADQVETLFEKDYDFELEYHSILNGKWDHMMDQTHIGYVYWQQPMTNSMPAVSRVQTRKQALPGVMRIVPERSMGAWPGDNPNDCAQQYSCPNPTVTLDSFDPFQNFYIDVGSGGPAPFTFNVTSNVTWLDLSITKGSITPDAPEQRVFISVPDWSGLSPGANTAELAFTATAQNQPTLQVPVTFIAQNTKPSLSSNFTGFVEGGGVVSFEAAHASRNNTVTGMFWKNIPGLGRTLSGVTPWPRLGNDENNFTAGSGPSLEYDFFLFSDQDNLTVITRLSPSLNAAGDDRALAFSIGVDESQVQTSHFIPPEIPGNTPPGWDGDDGFAANNIVSVNMTFSGVGAGAHTLKLFAVEPAVVVQKIDIDVGGMLPSYLGPPESLRV